MVGSHASNYLIPALAFASLLAGYMFVIITATINTTQSPDFKLVAWVVILILTIPVVMQTGVALIYLQSYNLNDELIIADYIKSHTELNEKIFVMPADAEYYFLSNREPASKNYWLLDITKNLTWTENSVIDELKEQK